MRLSWFAFPAAAVLAALIPAGHLPSIGFRRPVDHRSAEVERIRAHFDSVLTELADRDVQSIGHDARTRRIALTTTLTSYRARGEFPHNYDFPGEAVPYFIDRKTGTLCAVAYLLASTGRRDIVERVAAADNNVWVAELEGDREFESWLSENGITLEEAARIQVPYIGDPDPIALGDKRQTYSPAAIGIVAASAGASLWNVWQNADGRGRIGTVAGLAAGAAALGMGATAMGDPRAPRGVSAVSLAVGGIGAAIATRGFFRNRQYVAAQRDASKRQVAVAPIVPVKGKNGAGLSVQVTF
jgi:hypothetical protein